MTSHEEPPVAAMALSSFQSDSDGSRADVVAPASGTFSWAQRIMAEARASGLTSGWVAMDQDMAQGAGSGGGGGLSVKRGRCEETTVVMEPTLEPPHVRSSTRDGLPPSGSSSLIPCRAPAVEAAAPGSGSRLKKPGTATSSRRSSDGGGGGGEGGRRVRFEGIADDKGKELDGGRDGQGQRGGRGSGGAGHGRWGGIPGIELNFTVTCMPTRDGHTSTLLMPILLLTHPAEVTSSSMVVLHFPHPDYSCTGAEAASSLIARSAALCRTMCATPPATLSTCSTSR